MLEVQWLEFARDDLLAIIDSICEVDVDAALCLVDDIAEAVSDLPHSPLLGGLGRVEGTRELALSDYILVYRIYDFGIRVLRVLHAAKTCPSMNHMPRPDVL